MRRDERPYWVHSDPDADTPEAPSSAEICPVTHWFDSDRPRRTAPGSLLCRGCLEHLRTTIDGLPGQYDELEQQLTNLTRAAAGRVTGTPERALPVNLAVADMLSQIRHDLGWHVTWVATERGLTGAPAGGQVAEMCPWLVRHVEWIARQPEPEIPVETFRQLRGRSWALIDPRPRTEFGIGGEDGRCLDSVDGRPCEGILWVSGVFGEQSTFTVACTDCDRVYDSTQLLRLGLRIDQRRRRG